VLWASSTLEVPMAWESSSTLIAGVTGITGILATYLTARYSSKNSFRAMEAERRHRIHQATVAERKSAYVRMLQSFEEFDFTLSALQKNGYGRGAVTKIMELTSDIRELLVRNLEVDLRIQNIERELELIAPVDVIKACRRTFKALRDKTYSLTNYGELSTQPYNSFLAMTVSRMRLDLERAASGSSVEFIDDVEHDMQDIYELNAPESAIRLRLDFVDNPRAARTSRPRPRLAAMLSVPAWV
jgi:hypothetical protein